MRKFLVALPAALVLAHGAWGACGDTTVVLNASNPAFNTGTMVFNPGTLNTAIDQCADSTMTVTLENVSGNSSDTVKFSNELVVTSRPSGAVTRLVGKGRDGGNLIVTENSASDPLLFDIKINDKSILANFTFVRKTDNNNNHSVSIASKGSIVRDCHFFRQDNNSLATGSLLSITIDSVLVERCLFRTPPNGKGRAIAISAGGTSPNIANKNEYRSNIFYGTGLYLTAGSFHIFANTFTGSRDEYNAIVIGANVTAPNTALNIQHNLFAFKIDTMPPIFFNGSLTSADSILKNAYSRSKPTMPLAVNSLNAAVAIPNAIQGNANVELPKGFSRYSTHVSEFKEFPMVTLRTDENLTRTHVDFGKIPRIYNNTISTWTTMQDISSGLPSNKLYFSSGGNTFTPFVQGTTWGSGSGVGIKVGALVDLETKTTPPSPLDSGIVGKGLVIVRHPADSTRMRVSNIHFNRLWYDTLIPPSEMLFYFSTTANKLVSNDTATLRTATGGAAFLVRKSWLGFDSTLVVPKEVRVSENPIFVKMVHFNSGGQAPVLSVGATASIAGIPRFPINDLSIPVLDTDLSDTANGKFVFKVTKVGSEAIDSITVTPQRAGGGGTLPPSTVPAPAQGAAASLTFDLPSGQFTFIATPVARVGSTVLTGSSTAATRIYFSRQFRGDSVWVTNSTTTCGTKDGSKAAPFCTIDAGLALLATNGGGTLVLRNGTPAIPFQELTIGGADSSPVVISVPVLNNAFDPAHRVAFRGASGKEAITITRKNTAIRGAIIEMPAGSTVPAVTLAATATGVTLEGCLLRPTTASAVAGPAVSIETGGSGDARIVSNVIWGFTAGIRITSTSSGVRVLHNTFIDEPGFNSAPTTGISVQAATSTAVVANNFFSGTDTAFDASSAGKGLKLDHNIYTVQAPVLQGLSELGGIETVPRLGALELSAANWAQDFKLAMESITECSFVKACNTLYAGSSNDSYGQALTLDVVGKPRLGKPEVGAFEAEVSTSSVRGVLTMTMGSYPQGYPGAESRLPFTVTRKTLDTADADSLYIWWASGSNADLDDRIPSSNRKKFHISVLGGSTFADTATGLSSNSTYFVYAALGKTRNGVRALGYGYRASGLTQAGTTREDCTFGKGNSNCPTNVEFFSVPDGPAKDLFFTRVKFNLPDSGFVKVPKFDYAQAQTFGKVEINSPMPLIKLDLSAELTKQAGSNQHWTANIRLAQDPTALLAEKELFILPNDASTLPTFVPTWRLRKEGSDVWLDIEGSQSGSFTYGFGNMVVGSEAGKVTLTNAVDNPPRFSFKGSTDVDSVAITFRGTGFGTSNPLIIVTPMAAGGTVPNPFDGKWPNKSLLFSADYSNLSDTLKMDRYKKYFEQAVGADSTAPAPAGTNKPFQLVSMAETGVFKDVALMGGTAVAVSAAGESGEISVNLPIFTKYTESERYPDNRSRTTRSIEVMFTTFDGNKISRTSGFVRSEFSDSSKHSVHYTEKRQFDNNAWNLFSYPWDEADVGSLAKIVKSETWNKADHKLMKYKGAGNGAAAFLTFDGTNGDGFTYDAGNAVWSGSRNFYEPSCVSGVSLDYKPYAMAFPAGTYTDFGLPFNFAIKWQDILTASGQTAAGFRAWRYTPKTQGRPPSWDLLTDKSVVYPWQGLTAKPTAAVTLTIPILDSSRSATSLAKVATPALWTARLEAYDANALMNFRIGKAAVESEAPESPSVPDQTFRLALVRQLPDGRRSLSEHIQAGEDWRGHWALSGKTSKEGVRFKVSENAGEIPLYLVETLSRRVTPLTADAEVALGEEDMAKGDYHVVAGDSRYLQEVLDGLVPLHMLSLTNYPNPFSGSTLIRYALPEGFGKVEFRLAIRDSRGRLVWSGVQKGVGSSLRYLWDGRGKNGGIAPAGFYTLSLEAVSQGKATQRAVRRLLKM